YCFQSEILSEQELAVQIERAHRYASPNLIFIGEIRTRFAALEVLRVALGSSQQLVVATIHGLDIITALERLLNWARELDGNAAQNLANSLLAVIHQELHLDNGKRVLRIPQFLLVPFSESAKAIRSKIREGQLHSLGDDMREQRNRILYNRGLDK
ncbi:MAG: type II secretion system protein E, partial [Bilophila sp.]